MSRGIRLTALTAALTIALPMAPAAADRGHQVPDSAVITIKGDGSGHGRGLSQYGAYSAARKGKGYRGILGFYYPRTRWDKVGGSLEVLVSDDDDGVTEVRDVRGLEVRDVAAGRTHAADEGSATRWRIEDDGSGGSSVSWFDGSWHDWRTFSGAASFSAGTRALTLVTPDDGAVRYRGALRSDVDDFGDRVTVNDVTLEQYVRGVVAAEMPAGWPQQALRAQAVSARTYGAWRRDHPLDVAYDICDTALCQVYGGRSGETRASDKATARTAKQVLTYRRKPIFAEFSASNGGWTVAGGKPYLRAKRDRFEGTSRDYYGWRRRVTAATIEDDYNLENLTRIRIRRRDGNGHWGGRVTTLLLTTTGGTSPGTYSIDVERFRQRYDLKSTLFTIAKVR